MNNHTEIIYSLKEIAKQATCIDGFFHGTPLEIETAIQQKKLKGTSLILMNLRSRMVGKSNRKYTGTLAVVRPYGGTEKREREDDLILTESVWWQLLVPGLRKRFGGCSWFSCFTGELEMICEQVFSGWQIDFETKEYAAPNCIGSGMMDASAKPFSAAFDYSVSGGTLSLLPTDEAIDSAVFCVTDVCAKMSEYSVGPPDPFGTDSPVELNVADLLAMPNGQNRNRREIQIVMKATCTDADGREWVREHRAVVEGKEGERGRSAIYCS